MPTTFAKTKDRFKTTLASAHAIGDGILVLAAGAAASLGAPGANRVWRVTAVQNPDTSQEIVLSQFDATGVSGNNLTGVTPVTGYSDVIVPSGTPIRIRWTAKHVTEIQDALNTAETAIAANTAAFSNVVHLTGTESITGSKSFTGSLLVATAGTPFLLDGSTLAGYSGLWTGAAAAAPGGTNYAFLSSTADGVTAANVVTGGSCRLAAGGVWVLTVSDASTAVVPRVIISYTPLGTDGDTKASLSCIALNANYRPISLQGRDGQVEPLLPFRGVTSTAAVRDMGFVDAVWSVSTDASRLGELVLRSTGYNGTHDGMSFRDAGTFSQPIIPLANIRSAADDTAAAALTPPVPLGGLYRTASALKIRVS